MIYWVYLLISFFLFSVFHFDYSFSIENYVYKEKWGSKCSVNETNWSCTENEIIGDGKFRFPTGIALDKEGNVYVADSWNDRIQKFSPDGDFITKWGTTGSADGQFRFPTGIALDKEGNVYVADFSNDRIQKFSPDGDFITKWGTTGSADGQFMRPYYISVGGLTDSVYVSDFSNSRIQKFSPDGDFITKWGTTGSADGQFGTGDGTFFTGPTGIALDKEGNVYVADFSNSRIQKFSPDGDFITKWGTTGSADGQFRFPTGIALDKEGNVYVADSWNDRIQKFSPDGEFIVSILPAITEDGTNLFEDIFGMSIHAENIFLTDTRTDSVEIISIVET